MPLTFEENMDIENQPDIDQQLKDDADQEEFIEFMNSMSSYERIKYLKLDIETAERQFCAWLRGEVFGGDYGN